jgi:acyl-CoA thioesterase-1
MLGIALKKAYPNAKIEVFNAGISGHRTTDALARIDRDVLARKPHLVAVMFGLNDIVARDRKLYRDNLATIVARGRRSGAAVVLCTLNSVYPNDPRPQSTVAEFSQIVRDLARQKSVLVADCFRAYEDIRSQSPTEWMLLMSEDIHPCMDGDKLFAKTVAETIAGKPISLADVPPPADTLQFSLARLKAGQPVSVIAMPPYDRVIRDVLAELFPRATIDVTTWPVDGQSLSAMVKWSEGIRNRKPNLVVMAVPASADAKDVESFIRQYHWIRSNCVGYAHAVWDVVPILPSVTAPLAPGERERAELARRVIVGGDVEYVDRKPDDARSAREILLEWLRQREAAP